MQKNMVLFVVLSLAIFLGWAWAMNKFYPQAKKAKVQAGSEAAPASKPSPATAAKAESAAKTSSTPRASSPKALAPEKLVTLRSRHVEATLSTQGARLTSWKLLDYAESKHSKDPVELIPRSRTANSFAALELTGLGPDQQGWTLESQSAQKAEFSLALGGGAVARKSFELAPDATTALLKLTFENNGKGSLDVGRSGLLWGPNVGQKEPSQQFAPMLAGVVQLSAKIEREGVGAEDKAFTYGEPRWTALKSHYFVAAYLPEAGTFDRAEIRRHKDSTITVSHGIGEFKLAPGEKKEFALTLYAGPQIYETLKGLGRNLEAVVQFQFWRLFDWLNPLCVGMLKVLRWFQHVTGNWGIAIILLTALVRGALFYPSQKSMVSMRRMQTKMKAMQPRLDTIKKMYKDDAQKLNAEMMKLYREYGVNPLGGCLPMLIQIPIFFALYGTLMAAFELRGAPFFWIWDDLAGPDPTLVFFPIIMGASMFVQQKLTPNTAATMSPEQAQTQKIMLYMMPFMITGMSIWFKWPVGLLLYWSVSNIFAIAQQWYVNKTVT